MRILILVIGLVVAAYGIPAEAQRRPAAGTLISSEPMTGAPAGARAWRIRYASVDPRRGPVEITGFVVAPANATARGSRPVIAWAHGTSGITQNCGLSQNPNVFSATPALADMVSRGYVVVATDYLGLGTPGPHPYLVGDSTARAVLDSVRAAGQVEQARAGRRFAVWGESQGGHAALFTGEYARAYAPELELVGVAAAAPPTDLTANLTAEGDPSIRAFLTAYAAQGWADYFGVGLSSIGNVRTQRLIRTLSSRCISINSRPQLGTIIRIAVLRRDLRGVDLSRLQPWARLARENSVGQRPPGAPLLIAQSVSDPLVSPTVTRAFARRACRAGARLRFIDIPGGDHAHSARDSAPATLDWIADRFAGRTPPSDCARIG